MPDLTVILATLGAALAIAVLGWAWSLQRNNVNIVDTLWPVFFVVVLCTSAWLASPSPDSARLWLVAILTILWAARLAGYLGRRNHGKPEDHRYAAIRARNQPDFDVKSLYLVFGLQAVLAWLIAASLVGAALSTPALGFLDAAGAALWLVGFTFEVVGDAQLARFKRDPANRQRVMDRGLWRYTRHPNYFGEACIWWGFWLLACAGGAAWTVFSPLLMTVLLLKISGVALLEKDIADRRPGYGEYVRRTNAFLPGPPRRHP